MAPNMKSSLAIFALAIGAASAEYVCFYEDTECKVPANVPCLVGPPNTGECGTSPIAPQFHGLFTSTGTAYSISSFVTPNCAGTPLITLSANLDECTSGGAAGIVLVYKVTMGPQDGSAATTTKTPAPTTSTEAPAITETPTETPSAAPPAETPEVEANEGLAETTGAESNTGFLGNDGANLGFPLNDGFANDGFLGNDATVRRESSNGCYDIFLGDGVCDKECNTEEFNWDNGDC